MKKEFVKAPESFRALEPPYCNVLRSMEIVWLSSFCLHDPFKQSAALTDFYFILFHSLILYLHVLTEPHE